MQWLLNVHVHATFIEGRAHDAAARLNSRVLPRRRERKKTYEEEKIRLYCVDGISSYVAHCVIYANKKVISSILDFTQ